MEQHHKELLRTQRMGLKDAIQLHVSHIANFLLSKTIITGDMSSAVLCASAPADKAYGLLDLLPTRGPDAFNIFYQATLNTELWDAANLLKPENAPHARSCQAPGLPAIQACPVRANNGGVQVNLSFIIQDAARYGRDLQNDTYPQPRLHDPYHCPSVGVSAQGNNMSDLQLDHYPQSQPTAFCHPALPVPIHGNINTGSPQTKFSECHGLISQFKLPLNIHDYITLASIEQKLGHQNGEVFSFFDLLTGRIQTYQKEKCEKMDKEKAMRLYISLSRPLAENFFYFQVWERSQVTFLGPKILAVNNLYIRLLDIATKEVIVSHRVENINDCKISYDHVYTVILEFEGCHDPDWTLLSLEFEGCHDPDWTLLSLEFEKVFSTIRSVMAV